MNIIFDFDGVIISSYKVKTNAFYYLFKNFEKKIHNLIINSN